MHIHRHVHIANLDHDTMTRAYRCECGHEVIRSDFVEPTLGKMLAMVAIASACAAALYVYRDEIARYFAS